MRAQQIDEKAIFKVACCIESIEARNDYLNQVCGDNQEVRVRVATLLRMLAESPNFMESPLAGGDATLDVGPPLERLGTQIGPYKLVEQIGEGGMGAVYMATQREPIHRKVALKIIKPGMDTREVVARFEAERQALALMDHPNIAQVFDGGATDAGRPYFVMELVKGKPITEYCDREQLSTRERLALFVTLCHGVQHAHQKGVIHRDLKPSNLLIEVHDVRPVPKIIDFGIAKAMGQHLTERSLLTGFDQMVGTPLYMSPEQAGQSGLDVDTRSDIYSLGVLLYELLTGSTPFEKDTLRTAGIDEMRRIIREVDPPRPSARVSTLQAADLSTISQCRHVEPRKLSQQLRGDLDWIVMKALDKDRDRRYESVSALATDVQRYLDDEPVQARPPSLSHHAAKWMRRHRPLVWSSAVVLALAVLVGGALFWTGYRRVAQLERDAGEHLAAATALLDSGDYTAADRELADARGHLEAAGYRQGPLQEKMAELALPIAAVKRYEEFQSLRQRIHSEMYALDRDILDQAQTHCRAALDLFGVFDADSWKSQADFEHLDPARQSLLDEGAVELLFIWARLEMGQSDAQSATERTAGYCRAIETLGKIEHFHPPIPAVALWMADCWEAIGDQQMAALARARAESLHPTSATDYYLLGEYHAQHGQQDQALASYWQTLTQQPDHYLSLLAAGVALGELKEYKSAETMLTGAIALNPQTVIAYVQRATARREQSKIVLAQADIEEAKKRDPELARALIRRADEFRRNFQLDKALADYGEAIRLDPQADAYEGRGINYLLQGDLNKALADCNENIRIAPGSAGALSLRSEIYRTKGDLERALADANEALRLDPKHAWTYLRRGRIYENQCEWDKALADMNEAVRLEPNDVGLLVGRADIYRGSGDLEKALADYQDAMRLDPKYVFAYFGLAAFYQKNGDFEKALAALNEAIRIAPQYTLAFILRAAFHKDRGDFDKALADYNEAIRIAPQYTLAFILRAAFHKDRGDFEKALADYNEAIQLAPQDALAYANRATLHRDRGDFDKALADYNEAIRIAPSLGWIYHSRAELFSAQGNLDKALADENEALRLDPSSIWSYVCRAGIHTAKGDFDKALADCNEANRLDPKFAWAYGARGAVYRRGREFEKAAAEYDRAMELGPISWHFYKRAAEAHFQLQHYDKALECIAKAVELRPDDLTNLTWVSPSQVAKCPEQRFRTGLLELADKTIALNNKAARAYAARGWLLAAFGEQQQALADLQTAFDGIPKDDQLGPLGLSETCYELGHLCGELAHREETLPYLVKMTELQPQSAMAWYRCALGQLAAAQTDAYQATCRRMVGQFSDSTVPDDGNLLAWACTLAPDALSDWAPAVALAEKSVQSDPKSAFYLNTWGAVLYRAGRFDDALSRLSEAATLVPEPSEANKLSPAYIWFFLAMTQHRLGHAEEAKQWLDKAVAWTDKTFAEADQGTAGLSWNRRLTLNRLRDEATTVLGVTPPTVTPAPEPAAKVKEAEESSKSTSAPEPAKEEEQPK